MPNNVKVIVILKLWKLNFNFLEISNLDRNEAPKMFGTKSNLGLHIFYDLPNNGLNLQN